MRFDFCLEQNMESARLKCVFACRCVFLLTVNQQEVEFGPEDEDRIRTKYLLYIL